MTESSFSSLMWMQSWQICAVVGMVWLATRLLRNRSPHIIHALWLVVLLKCATPPLWSNSAGMFCWVQSIDTSKAEETEVVAAPVVQHTADNSVLLEPVNVETERLTESEPLASYDDVPQPVSTAEAHPKPTWITWLLIVWVGGIVTSTAILCVQFIRCLLLCRNSDHHAELQQAVELLAQKIGVRRRVRVLVTPSNVGPAVVGIFRPVMILPEAIVRGASVESLHPVLMHELIHIRRGDLWLGILEKLTRLFWWFHPLVHWSVRQASRSAEACCDQESLAALKCSPRYYAQCLLTILEQKKQLTPIPSCPGVRAVDITSNRLEQIMKTRQGSLRNAKRWSICVLLLSALITLPGAAFVASAAESSRSEVSSSENAVPHDSEVHDNQEKQQRAQNYTTRAYPVADFVVPVPEKVTVHVAMSDTSNGEWGEWDELSSLTGPAARERLKQRHKTTGPSVNFGLLRNIIMTTVLPESWDVRGGEGAIASNSPTMSLVIRQRSAVHDAIVELFQQLRCLRDLQLTHELTVTRLSGIQYKRLATDFGINKNQATVLSEAGTTNWNRVTSEVKSTDRFHVKFTIFNEQRLALTFPGQQVIGLAHVISADRRKVRFRIRPNSTGHADTVVVDDGAQLLIDVTNALQTSNEFVIEDDEHVVVSITPRIVIVEEEEELVDPARKVSEPRMRR